MESFGLPGAPGRARTVADQRALRWLITFPRPLPFSEDEAFGRSFDACEIGDRLLIYEISAFPFGIGLESQDAMQQKMHGAQLLAGFFATIKSSLPFHSVIGIDDDRALKMFEGAVGTTTKHFLHVGQNEAHLGLECAKYS
jgi:hypothetical protein